MQTQTGTSTRRAAPRKPHRKAAVTRTLAKPDAKTRELIEAIKGLKGLKLVR